jgi:hypothetical protein
MAFTRDFTVKESRWGRLGHRKNRHAAPDEGESEPAGRKPTVTKA